MLAQTEINLVNGLAALALGFGLLVLVAWVDRRYLQRYEDVQSADEEARAKVEGLDKAEGLDTGATPAVVVPATGNVTRVPKPVADEKPAAAVAEADAAPKKVAARKDEPAPAVAEAEPEAAPVAPVVAAETTPPARAARAAEVTPVADAETARPAAAEAMPARKAPRPKPVSAPPAPVATSTVDETELEPRLGRRETAPAMATSEPIRWKDDTVVAGAPTADAAARPKPAPAATDDEKPAEAPKLATRRAPAAKPVIAAPVAEEPTEIPEPAPVAKAGPTIDLTRDEPKRKGRGGALPKGAEAALASILEAVPDPRNTIAVTRDPTAEVTVTPADRAQAIRSSGEPRADYQPPEPDDAEWETPKEAAGRDLEPGRRPEKARRT